MRAKSPAAVLRQKARANLGLGLALVAGFLAACEDSSENDGPNEPGGVAGTSTSSGGANTAGGSSATGAGRSGASGGTTGQAGTRAGTAGNPGGDAGRESTAGRAGSAGDGAGRGGSPATGGDTGTGEGGETARGGSAGSSVDQGGQGSGQAGEPSGGEGGESGTPGACHDLVNDASEREEWTVDGWLTEGSITAPLTDLPGERDLYAIFIDTGVDGQTDRRFRGKTKIRDVSTNPTRGTFDVLERFSDLPAEQRATYTFELLDANTGRVALTWICGDKIPFFEDYTGFLSFTVDFQIVFTREPSGSDPFISRDYRTRDFDL
ncbi:MAG TPA: hypothetical protein VGK73_24010 [Polyangiaceae bacterium]